MQEEWRPVVGYEGLYEVSDQGRVRSLDRIVSGKRYRGRALNPVRRADGYAQVNMPGRRSVRVHTLVLAAFVGPRPPGHHGAHRDGDSTNDRLDNLRWATPKENEADKIRHGRGSAGGRNGAAKLTAADVAAIRGAVRGGRDLAARYGVHPNHITRIRAGGRW